MAVLVACDRGGEVPPRPQPNIILILLDTVRADHLGTYGYPEPTSPNLDALASDGVVFERTISPSPWTVPSFGSILTSTHPSEHRAGARTSQDLSDERTGRVSFDALGKLDPTLPTVASLLAAHGWATQAVLANPNLPSFGLFQEAYDHVDHRRGSEAGSGFRRAAEITDLAIQAIENTAGEPYFLAVHYIDPHAPYDPRGAVPAKRSRQYAQREDISIPRSQAIVSYDQEIRDMDAEIGRLLDALRARGDYAGSLIVVIADHGEELWDHDDREKKLGPTVVVPNQHGHTFYQELLHVPLIIKFPGLARAGARNAQLASSMDVLPTILDIAGIAAPDHLRGISLADRQASDVDSRAVLSEHPIFADDRKAIVQGSTKYILNTVTGSERFLELAEGDYTDRDVTSELSEERKQHMRELMERALTGRRSSASEDVVDAETLDSMRALGYVE